MKINYLDIKMTRLKKSVAVAFTALFGVVQGVSAAGCVVAGTNFDTSKDLCSPDLEADSTGWYSSKLNLKKECAGLEQFTGPETAKQLGLSSAFTVKGSNDFSKADAIFKTTSVNINGQEGQYGVTGVAGNPKFAHSFAQSINNNMLVNIGSGQNCDFLTYTVNGLEPGSDVTLSFTLYNLLDKTYFEHLTENVIPGSKPKKNLSDFISKYTFAESSGTINGNGLQFAVSSNADGITYNTGYGNTIQAPSGMGANVTTASPAYGTKTSVKHKTKVPSSGSITFYFYRTNDSYQIPIGIDDIEVEGSIKPSIAFTGNPCPEQPLRIFAKQSYPEGTKFSWKEAKTGQSSTDANFVFTPDKEETDYTVTLEVTLPGCTTSKSDPITVHSGTCCKSSTGAPMAMTNLFFDDFGNFVTDDTYEWTDRFGVTHTEKIPPGQVHTAQSHGGDLKIPYVKAYNIESSGATLAVPVAGSVPNKTELYNHGVYVVSKYGGYPSGVPYDNSGTQTGGMLQFDLEDDGSQDDFFEIDIDHICTGKEINFGADFASISNHPGAVEVVLEYKGKKLESDFRYFSGGSDGWKSVNKSFTIKSEDVGGASEVTVTMKVRHYGKMADGTPITGETRDYGIDNIIFQVCTPPDVDVESSVSTGKDYLDLCTEDALTLTVAKTPEAKKALQQFYAPSSNPGAKLGFVYQYTFQDPSEESETNPIAWNTIHKSKDVVEEDEFEIKIADYWDDIFAELDKDENKGKMIFFRVVVGEYSDLLADDSWKTSSAFSPCRKISISTVRLFAGLNCAACEKAKSVDIEAADKTTTIEKVGKKKVVNLCEGETASLKAGPFEPTDDTVMDANDSSLPRQYTSTLLKGDNPKTATKVKSFAKGVSPEFEISYDDAGVYLLRVEDADFSDAESCYVYDTIEIVANPKPTDLLDNPDPFCEGLLTTEPDKSITGYDILWYTAEDTATASKEPVVKTVAATDSPVSSWYVLVDKKTGCRGAANEYVVTVNKAENLNVTGNITVNYTKTEAVGGTLSSIVMKNPSISDAFTTGYDKYFGKADVTSLSPLSATYGAASSTVPVPTITDPASSDDEKQYYYMYQMSPEGCLSDTAIIVVNIYGAPAPDPIPATYCYNSVIKPMSAYAKVNQAVVGETYTLTFYKNDKTTKMDPADVPELVVGENIFYVTQSSVTGGESSFVEIVITVINVLEPTVEADGQYCLNDNAKSLDEVVTKATSGTFNLADGFEWFVGSAPIEGAASSAVLKDLAVSTAVATDGDDYYVRQIYTLPSTKEICYGPSVKYSVVVEDVEVPTSETGFIVNYLKSEGASGFKSALVQAPTAVKPATGCKLQWYKEDGTKCNEPTPVYDANLVGDKREKYYVSQINANGCESEKVEVTLIVSGFPVPTPHHLKFCAESPLMTGNLQADINVTGTTYSESEFELVWYKEDPMVNPSAIPYSSIDLASEDLTVPSTEKEKEFNYYVKQKYLGVPSGESAPATLNIIVFANPKLKAKETDPICEGETTDLKKMYDVSDKVSFNVDVTFHDISGNVPTSTLVGIPGTYTVQGFFDLPTETCMSNIENLEVVVHNLTPKIEGSNTTCPGVAVDLVADHTTNVPASDITYSWTTTTSVSGTSKNFNTTTAGLAATGNQVTVNLNVVAGACSKNADPFVIVVGDGIIKGDINFSEADNTTPLKSFSATNSNIVFTSCGTDVTTEISVTADVDDYKLVNTTTNTTKTGKLSGGKTTLTLGAGTYRFEYTNECPTSFSFTIMDVSISGKEKHESDVSICEGETFESNIELKLASPTYPYEVKWYKDDIALSQFTTTKLSLTNAKRTDSGVYSFELLSGGCSYKDKVAMGFPIEVKPNIAISSSLVTSYEVVRGESLDAEIPFDEPSDGSTISGSVTWSTEYGDQFVGNKITIPSVEKDYDFTVVAEPAGYCPGKTNVTVKMEAKLVIDGDIDVTQMCIGENHVITIDTAGTGKFLHPSELELNVVETTAVGTKTINLVKSSGKLSATISPVKDATYSITYKYPYGNQDESFELTLPVHEAFNVTFQTEPAEVCSGDEAYITVTNVYPDDGLTTLTWDESNFEILNGSQSGATVAPEFTAASGVQQNKTFKVTVSNGICKDVYYYPSVKVDKPISGEIEGPESICEGDPVTLSGAAFEATSYKWTYLEIDSTMTGEKVTLLPIPEYASFVLDMKRGACNAQAEFVTQVTSMPKVQTVDSIGYRSVDIVLESGTGTEPFKYIVDGESDAEDVMQSTKEGLSYGSHKVQIVDAIGCKSDYRFTVNAPTLTFPVVITPEGDGVGDKFVVETLKEAYPDAQIKIFDRWGKQVASYKAGDDKDWDGTYNGVPMPSTDYWYEIEITEIEKVYTGHFTLIRQ